MKWSIFNIWCDWFCQDGLDESLLSEEAGTRGGDVNRKQSADEGGIFQISKKIEFGEMAVRSYNLVSFLLSFAMEKSVVFWVGGCWSVHVQGMFFNQWGIIVFYSALIVSV